MGVASLLGDTGRMEEGLQFMEKAVEVSGGNPNVYNNLGAYLLRLGDSTVRDRLGAAEKIVAKSFLFSLSAVVFYVPWVPAAHAQLC